MQECVDANYVRGIERNREKKVRMITRSLSLSDDNQFF